MAPVDPSFAVTRFAENTLALEGELDLATCPILDRSMDLRSLACRVMVLDLSDLTFIDATASMPWFASLMPSGRAVWSFAERDRMS